MDMSRACVYIALDELLGWGWGRSGRQQCRGIITAHNGYPNDLIIDLPRLAPVWVYQKLFDMSYNQSERMVRGRLPGGNRISIAGKELVIFVYEHGSGMHAVCAPVQLVGSLNVVSYQALIVKRGTSIIIDRW